jgi:hypothetical protein
MYNQVKAFVFGKENINKDISTIEKNLSGSAGYIQNKYGNLIFPNNKKNMDFIWKQINLITNPSNGFLKNMRYDFKLSELNNFENLNLQKNASLDILSDKGTVQQLIRNGNLKTTLGSQYNNLTEEQRDIIDLVNDKLNDKPKMVQDIFDEIESDRGLNIQSNLKISNPRSFEDFVGFQELKKKRSDITEQNFGYYFISLICRSIYSFYVDTVAEQISISYRYSSTTATTTVAPTVAPKPVTTGTSSRSTKKRSIQPQREIRPSDIDLSKFGL